MKPIRHGARRVRWLWPLVLWLLPLAGCHRDDKIVTAGGSSPVAGLQQAVARMRAHDPAGFWKLVVPPADYATLRADWPRLAAHALADDPATHARFAAVLRQLDALHARDTLPAQWLPALSAMQAQYGDQLPVLIRIGEAFVRNRVTQNPALDPTRKAALAALLDALAPWVQQTDWFDPVRARQAIIDLVAVARRLDLQSPDQLATMDPDRAMADTAIGMAGLEQVLTLYGLPVDQVLSSVQPRLLGQNGDRALVRIDYVLLARPLSLDTSLVRQDGRWYDADLIALVRRWHAELTQPDATPNADAGHVTAMLPKSTGQASRPSGSG